LQQNNIPIFIAENLSVEKCNADVWNIHTEWKCKTNSLLYNQMFLAFITSIAAGHTACKSVAQHFYFDTKAPKTLNDRFQVQRRQIYFKTI
jgi:hypothetical protein